jgi:predicted ribosome quality control (RQC) complex YloA/Tae2 family protein
MQKMSGADLAYAVSELAQLQGKRIARIRRTPSGIFLFKIGGEEVLFQPGVRLHLTRQALQATDAPDGFVGFLRKALEGKTAQTIAQVPGDRIVEITTRSKERLIFELFRKGNLIFVGEDGLIYACLQKDEAGGRRVSRGERYEYPQKTPYAAKQPESVAFVVKENEKGEPVGFCADASQEGKRFASFFEALDHYYANQREDGDLQRQNAEKMQKLKKRLESQKQALFGMMDEQDGARKAGDAIIKNFDALERLLYMVRKMKKQGASEDEINRGIARYKASVNGTSLEIEI